MQSISLDFKVVLLGKELGGKTCLLQRFLHDSFNDMKAYKATVGVAYGVKKMTSNKRTITFQIWDTAGSERYEAMSRLYYRNAKAAIICYDITDKKHLERALFWIRILCEMEENCKLYIVGTKLDLVQTFTFPREVDFNAVKKFAGRLLYTILFRDESGMQTKEIDAFAIETSSKSGENVQELFQKIADDLVKNLDLFEILDDVNGEKYMNDLPKLYLREPPPSSTCC